MIEDPALIGTIITAIIALILSLKNSIDIKKHEDHKARLSFAKEKLTQLRDAKEVLPKESSNKLAFDAVDNRSTESLEPFVKEIQTDYSIRKRKYEEIRFCFLKKLRSSLDRSIGEIKEKDWLVNKYGLTAVSEGRQKEKIPENIWSEFHESISLKIKFCSEFDEAIKLSMDVLSDQLS